MTDTPVQDRAGQAWETLDEAVFQSIGFGSSCWATLQGAGEFDSTAAKTASEELLKFIRRGVLDPDRSKGEAIVEDCLIREEPFFVFRARDIFALAALNGYMNALQLLGPYNPEFEQGVVNSIAQFREWQSQNVRSVKYPD